MKIFVPSHLLVGLQLDLSISNNTFGVSNVESMKNLGPLDGFQPFRSRIRLEQCSDYGVHRFETFCAAYFRAYRTE